MTLNSLYRSAALAAVLALGAAGFTTAQEAAPAEAVPLTKDTAKVGEVYLAETNEPWETRCTKTEDGADPCQLYQLLKDETGGAVAEFSMFAVPTGNEAVAGATVIVPLETLLGAGLIMGVDENEPKGYPYAFCTSYGCIARLGFTAEELAAMKDGKAAKLQLAPAAAPEERVNLTLSLKGFTAGYDAVAATLPAKSE